MLEPLGFLVIGAADAQACLAVAAARHVDLFLLDIGLPCMDGLQLAARLRQGDQADAPIIMVSADAYESRRDTRGQAVHDDFIVKPVDFWVLLEKLQHHLPIDWVYEESAEHAAEAVPAPAAVPDDLLQALWALGESGHVRGIHHQLDELERRDRALAPWAQHLRTLVKGFQLNHYMKALESARAHAR